MHGAHVSLPPSPSPRARFEDQVRQKDAGDHEAMPFDEDSLRAREYGLPRRAGSVSASIAW
jgi:lysyl-tRNA synthetase class II